MRMARSLRLQPSDLALTRARMTQTPNHEHNHAGI
jgi:hypothetical protein